MGKLKTRIEEICGEDGERAVAALGYSTAAARGAAFSAASLP